MNAVVPSSSFSGFGAFDRKESFGCTGEPGGFGRGLEIDRSEEFEEVSSEPRPTFDVIRSNFADAEVGVCGRNVGECCSEPVESSLEAARTVDDLRRGSCIGVVTITGSFPSLGMDVDGSRREIEPLRLFISFHRRWEWYQRDVVVWLWRD